MGAFLTWDEVLQGVAKISAAKQSHPAQSKVVLRQGSLFCRGEPCAGPQKVVLPRRSLQRPGEGCAGLEKLATAQGCLLWRGELCFGLENFALPWIILRRPGEGSFAVDIFAPPSSSLSCLRDPLPPFCRPPSALRGRRSAGPAPSSLYRVAAEGVFFDNGIKLRGWRVPRPPVFCNYLRILKWTARFGRKVCIIRGLGGDGLAGPPVYLRARPVHRPACSLTIDSP